MTTPETARTAEPTTEQVSAYRDYLHYSHPHGRFTYDENAAVLAAIAFVRSCLPAALPSPASDKGNVCACGKWRGHAFACNDCTVKMWAAPPPASDRCTCDKFERGHDEHEPWCGGPAPSDHPHASIQCGWCGKQFPIPAGTVLDVNKCPECRAKDAALFHPRARQSGPSARSVSDRGRVDVEDGRGNVVMDAACPRGCSALRSARVPLPQQQEDDRSWEKECVVRANGVVSYLSTASHTGTVYLVPDGRWVTYDQWFLLTAPSDRFPTTAAAFSALAKAPRPPT